MLNKRELVNLSALRKIQPLNSVRRIAYNQFKGTPSFDKELNMMKQLYRNPKPLNNTKIKTKIIPVKMDKFIKDYNIFKKRGRKK